MIISEKYHFEINCKEMYCIVSQHNKITHSIAIVLSILMCVSCNLEVLKS